MPESTIPLILNRAATTWPDKAAIVSGHESLTFGALQDRVTELAKVFLAHDLLPGERFAIWAPNSVIWQVIALAGQAIGGVLVPINTRYKTAECQDIILRSKARIVFYSPEFLGIDYEAMLAEMQFPDNIQVLPVDNPELFKAASQHFEDSSVHSRANGITGRDLADILYTSGTTGAPKGVMTSHEQNIAVFRAWSSGVTLNTSDRYLIVNPYFHAFGYKAGWLAALIQGATIYPMPSFDIDETLQLIQDEKITFLPGAPTIFQSLLMHPGLGRYELSSLRCAVTGAASVPVQLVRDMKEVLAFDDVYTAYGLTESTGVVSLCQSGDDIETIATTSGKPMEGVEVLAVDPDGRPVAAGETGEIRVRGFNVMQGYLDDPEATAEAITPDGWLKTGDLGVINEAGYLRITDRVKDMFISGGFNCYPAEIENMLLEHKHISDVAVIGVPDNRLGEVCEAHVVTNTNSFSTDEFLTWAKSKMANYKAPRHLVVHQTLPRNASGKVQKFLLKKPDR